MRAALAALLALMAAPAAAQTIAPWTEAVVSVRDPEGASRLFRDVGWTAVARGAVARSELDYWKLPGAASARFLKICAPGTSNGCLRFVSFKGVQQRIVRLATRPWDTGGIFSVMMRSTDVQSVFDRALAIGWHAETPVYRFEFNGSKLANVVLHGPDGFSIALYERSSPAFTAYPLGPIARAFNSMRMVRDQRASVAFYRDKLGFSSAFDQDYLDPAPGPNNFSIPQNYADKIARRASAMYPVPGEEGRIELMQFVGFTGRDVSTDASPPNLGVVSLRYPVSGLSAYRATLGSRGVAFAYASPGRIAVRDPDGNLTEFYEAGTTRR